MRCDRDLRYHPGLSAAISFALRGGQYSGDWFPTNQTVATAAAETDEIRRIARQSVHNRLKTADAAGAGEIPPPSSAIEAPNDAQESPVA
jgi:hypothetical protein